MAGFHRETKKKNRFERALQTDRHTDRPSQRQKIVDSYAKRGVNIYNSVIQHSWVDLTSSGGGETFPPWPNLETVCLHPPSVEGPGTMQNVVRPTLVAMATKFGLKSALTRLVRKIFSTAVLTLNFDIHRHRHGES